MSEEARSAHEITDLLSNEDKEAASQKLLAEHQNLSWFQFTKLAQMLQQQTTSDANNTNDVYFEKDKCQNVTAIYLNDAYWPLPDTILFDQEETKGAMEHISDTTRALKNLPDPCQSLSKQEIKRNRRLLFPTEPKNKK